MLEERLGLNVDLKITLGPLGGDQELGALVSRGEVYCSFLFRDPLALAQTQMFDLLTYLKLCDIHNSMIATNPQSANKLMYALTRSPECKVELFKTENKSKPSQSNIIQLYKTRMKQIQTLNNDAIASSRSQQVHSSENNMHKKSKKKVTNTHGYQQQKVLLHKIQQKKKSGNAISQNCQVSPKSRMSVTMPISDDLTKC
mmetsp:Transcript_14142/g.17753  ORF Transcript_14142/g.17753 Transcript_14142/m.17753 type:complete len:200 (+) Transcript_14142:1-600(+)